MTGKLSYTNLDGLWKQFKREMPGLVSKLGSTKKTAIAFAGWIERRRWEAIIKK